MDEYSGNMQVGNGAAPAPRTWQDYLHETLSKDKDNGPMKDGLLLGRVDRQNQRVDTLAIENEVSINQKAINDIGLVLAAVSRGPDVKPEQGKREFRIADEAYELQTDSVSAWGWSFTAKKKKTSLMGGGKVYAFMTHKGYVIIAFPGRLHLDRTKRAVDELAKELRQKKQYS